MKKNKKRKRKNKKIENMTFSELIEKNPKAAKIFFEKGMNCAFCPLASKETLEQGAKSHNIDIKELIKELNKNKKKK
ncbi:MAG: DUF1858 domain-containing protein [Candidatus Pacearchaeota archaeon]